MVVEPSLERILQRLSVCSLHLQADGQVCGEERSLQARTCPAFLCNWCSK